MESWTFGFTANAVIALAYLGISATVFLGLRGTGQWRKNPLALATGLIFLSCAAGHGVHAYHALATWDVAASGAQRTIFGEWHVWAIDGLTAIFAVWYFSLRGRFPMLVRGAALFEDMKVRQRQALEIHDNVVQGLVKAKLSIEAGQSEQGRKELEETLDASRRIMSELLGEAGRTRDVKPGELVRQGSHKGVP